MERMLNPRVNMSRVKEVAALLAKSPPITPLNFYSVNGKNGETIVLDKFYPPLHAPWAIDFFWYSVIQNSGFWLDKDGRYDKPLLGTLNGKANIKGSDLLWQLILRAFNKDPDQFAPKRLAKMRIAEFRALMSDDNGQIPMLSTRERHRVTQQYGKWLVARKSTPKAIVERLRESAMPVSNLLRVLQEVPGYKEDVLAKKSLLLTMVMVSRPERFLVPEGFVNWAPIVDYHLMRTALRLGMVDLPPAWKAENIARTMTSGTREFAIRRAVYDAVRMLIDQSGKSMFEIDALLWGARKYCPEMETPDCASCLLASACAKRVDLFQPVFRTMHY